MSDEARPILEVRGVTKTFPGVIANEDVDLTLHEGQVLCVLGENGAGKSTLMNTVFGLYQPDAGEIRLRGEPVQFGSSRDAIAAGIGMVHQHFQLIPVFTVVENVMLGDEMRTRRLPRPGRRPRPHPRARGAVRPHDRPRRPGRRPVGGRAAAGRADQGALPAGRHPDPRRAHRGPHPRRGRRVLRRRPIAGRPGQVDHLHHPQAPRGARRRRPDRGAPRRQGRRHRRSEERHPAVAGHAHGRSRRVVHHRQGPGHARRAGPPTSASCGSTTTAASPPSPTSTSRCGPARCSASPASRATASASWSRPSWGCAPSDPVAWSSPVATSPTPAPARSSSSASGTCPRTAASTGSWAPSRSPTTSCSTATGGAPFARRGLRDDEAIERHAEALVEGVRRPHAQREGRRPTPSRAATSRR